MATTDAAGLTDGDVSVARRVEILRQNPAEGVTGAGHTARSVDQDAAASGCALFGEDTPARLANDRRGCGNCDRAKRILNDRDAARRPGNGPGQIEAEICLTGLSASGRAQIDSATGAAAQAAAAVC